MKDKPSEWVAISDLMAGVLAVVMLLLVVSVLQKSASAMQHQAELAAAKGTRSEAVAKVTEVVSEMIARPETKGLMTFDARTSRLLLSDGVFERGSACLKSDIRAGAAALQEHIAHFLTANPTARILVEGHTDNIAVGHAVTDQQRFCTVYDDNFTLSAARAREARKALIGDLDKQVARRVVVAGYGDSRPLPGISPSESKNRRVEVQFVVDVDEPHDTEPVRVAGNLRQD